MSRPRTEERLTTVRIAGKLVALTIAIMAIAVAISCPERWHRTGYPRAEVREKSAMAAAGHYASAGPWTTKDTIVFVGLAVVVGVPLLAYSVSRIRRAANEVRASLQHTGYEVVQLQFRLLRWGPYSWTTNQRSQLVYRVVVREPGGRERHGWARWGRPWFWMDDKLEFRWDDQEQGTRP